MTKSEELFHSIASELPDVVKGKMFGALCIKALNGKAGVMFKYEKMIFKLPAKLVKEALQLPNTQIFDPKGGRPMNGGWK